MFIAAWVILAGRNNTDQQKRDNDSETNFNHCSEPLDRAVCRLWVTCEQKLTERNARVHRIRVRVRLVDEQTSPVSGTEATEQSSLLPSQINTVLITSCLVVSNPDHRRIAISLVGLLQQLDAPSPQALSDFNIPGRALGGEYPA